MMPKKETNVHATEMTVSRQTGKLITLTLVVFLLDFHSVPIQSHKCFIDVFEYVLHLL